MKRLYLMLTIVDPIPPYCFFTQFIIRNDPNPQTFIGLDRAI